MYKYKKKKTINSLNSVIVSILIVRCVFLLMRCRDGEKQDGAMKFLKCVRMLFAKRFANKLKASFLSYLFFFVLFVGRGNGEEGRAT